MSAQGKSKLERAQGEGRAKEEAVAKALARLGLPYSAKGRTEIEVVREGVYSFFGNCKLTWLVRVTNLDAVEENLAAKQRREEEHKRRLEESNRKKQEEQDRLALQTVRRGLDRGAKESFWSICTG